MARRQHEAQYKTEDGEVTITLQAMGGVKAGQLGLRLGKLIGPGLTALIMAAEKSDSAGVAAGLKELFGQLSESEYSGLLKQVIAEGQLNDGESLVDLTVQKLDSVFEGSPGSVYKVLFDGLVLNFRNFTAELGLSADLMTRLATLGKKMAPQLSSTQPKSAQPTPTPPAAA